MMKIDESMLGPRLRKFLSTTPPDNAPLPLVFSLKKSAAQLLRQNQNNWKTRSEKIRNCRKRIRAYQKPVVDALSNEDGVNIDVTLWINNKIVVLSNAGVLNNLRAKPFDDDVIKRIHTIELVHTLSYPHAEHDHKPKKFAGEKTTTRIPTDNIKKIDAPAVWKAGFKGKGVIIALIDCGVYYLHPDLKDQMWNGIDAKFDGKPIASIHGYDCGEKKSDPKDIGVHGTFSAGVLVGNGTRLTTTGVAPEATLMALKVIKIEGGKSVFTDTACWMAMQFAIENGAHLICSTVSFPYALDPADNPDLDNWREACDTLYNFAMVLVNSAGNGAIRGVVRPPPPFNIDVPASCPPPILGAVQQVLTTGGTSSVLACGAALKNDHLDTYSSIGKSQWNTTTFNDYPTANLMKPDLCAPSEGIVSCNSNLFVDPEVEPYSDCTGGIFAHTSASAPHVAGALALIISAVGPDCWDITAMKTAVDLMMTHCDPMYNQATASNLPIMDEYRGAGRLNIFKAGKGTYW